MVEYDRSYRIRDMYVCTYIQYMYEHGIGILSSTTVSFLYFRQTEQSVQKNFQDFEKLSGVSSVFIGKAT
jgi:hypothetical protein